MKVHFIKVHGDEIFDNFPEFYDSKKEFFEINKEMKPIGFYGIKKIDEKTGEISVYFNESDRHEITKSVALGCLTFPFSLGFQKILISTKVKNVERFLRKMTKIGVKYLFKNNDLHWFEVIA